MAGTSNAFTEYVEFDQKEIIVCLGGQFEPNTEALGN
jgi:hypothetical protein